MMKTYRSTEYLEFVRMHPCCVCMAAAPNDPHHVSFVEGTGMGMKPNDLYTVPLCRKCHDQAHNSVFWRGKFSLEICKLLAEWIERHEIKAGGNQGEGPGGEGDLHLF